MGRLEVCIIQAKDLISCEMLGLPDPYVTLKLEGNKRKTKIIRNSRNPCWNETFNFMIKDENSSQLELEVWNSNPVKDDFMGNYWLSLSGLTRGVPKEQNIILQGVKSGEVKLVVTATDFGLVAPTEMKTSVNDQTNPYKNAPTHIPPPVQQPSFPVQQPGFPVQQPGFPVQQPSFPVQQPSFPVQQPGFSVQQPGYPMQQPGYPMQQPGYPMQQPGFPMQQPGYPMQQPGYPMQQPGFPVQQPGYPMQQPGFPVQQPGYPMQQQGYPMQQQGFSQSSSGPFGVQMASGIPPMGQY